MLILDYALNNTTVDLIGGGWHCLLHEEPEMWLVFQHVDGGDTWQLDLEAPWRELEGGVYTIVIPGQPIGFLGSCARVGRDVDHLIGAAEAERAVAHAGAAAIEALRELKRPKPPEWSEATINPTPGAAACTEYPFDLVMNQQPVGESFRHAVRIAIRPRSDGVIWVAVEDDAEWPTACHVYSAGDWTHNPETGWYHSDKIGLYFRR